MSDVTMQGLPEATEPAAEKKPFQLRLWPGVVLVGGLWLARLSASIGEFAPSKFFFGMIIAPFAVLGGLLLWTLFASRLKWSDRWLISGTLVAATAATLLISRDNFPLMALVLYSVPPMTTVWVGWLLFSGWLNWPVRRAGVLLIFLVTAAVSSSLRIEGMDGAFTPKFSWRWRQTAEQQLVSDLQAQPSTAASTATAEEATETVLAEQPGDWPGFRGQARDGRLAGVRIATDWDQAPPKELWRHRIGPGWSSVTVVADRVFTQEQRLDNEYVVCYHATNGKQIWSHHDKTRFTETVAGPGPRATPTFHAGRIYALGANGNLNCLNASTGKVIWTRDVVADTTAKVPMWGFSSSPLVAHGVVTVFTGAPEGKSVVAYRADSGELAWNAGEGSLSYCSPQLATIDGVDQVLITSDAGLSSFEPETGKILWHHEWIAKDIARVVQPAVIDQHDVLIGTGMGVGTRRLSLSHTDGKWQTEERWTTREIKPYYNDLVLHDGHLYGFDNNIFMCIDLKDGSRKWRARGYGNGQVLLLADQSLLVIVTEQGEVALVDAKADGHHELCRFKAIEGKTWNHPVVAGGKLIVRNGEEIACFQLSTVQ